MTREEAINKAWVYLTSRLPIEDYEEVEEIIKAIEQPCEDAVSRKEVFETFGELLGIWGTQALMEMPSATPARKTGKWIDTGEISTNRRGQIIHEVICSKCNGISYFRSMGNKYISATLCPNCGSRNEVEYDNR
jgi:hypothetical protein